MAAGHRCGPVLCLPGGILLASSVQASAPSQRPCTSSQATTRNPSAHRVVFPPSSRRRSRRAGPRTLNTCNARCTLPAVPALQLNNRLSLSAHPQLCPVAGWVCAACLSRPSRALVMPRLRLCGAPTHPFVDGTFVDAPAPPSFSSLLWLCHVLCHVPDSGRTLDGARYARLGCATPHGSRRLTSRPPPCMRRFQARIAGGQPHEHARLMMLPYP